MVKLKSGKELELRPLTRKEALRCKIASIKQDNDFFYDAALLGTGLTPAEMEDKYSDNDIIEIAQNVFDSISLSEEQKKS